MDFSLSSLIDIFIHLDKYLGAIISQYGTMTYIILFLVIFCETGLVVTPFLPGDSLLFAAGTFAALGALDVHLLFFILLIAAILGDTVNYSIGKFLGPKVFTGHYKFLKKEYLEKASKFYEKYGAKTIIIARFVPIVRTFAPFVAGIGKMHYGKFITYNIVGGLIWTAGLTYAGYFFGTIPFIKNNFSVAIMTIIFISLLPAIIELIREKRKAKTAQ